MGNKASNGTNGGNSPNPSNSSGNNEGSEEFSEENRTTRGGSQSGSSTSNNNNNNSGKSPSYYTMIKNSYQQLVNAIIRLPRSRYDLSQLGPPKFKFAGKTFQRTDFTLTNPRHLKIECSFWEPVEADRPAAALPCVIYMHGNSSCRLEGLSSLSVALTVGATLLAFDFSGSGLSEGEYVSLGAYEKDDLQCVIEHLRGTQKTSTIALWGRSMGAATALLHGERDPSIAGMVLDSAFADLVMLAQEMVEKGRQQGLFAPSILVNLALKFVRSSVQKAANFDIKSLSPIEHADKCFIPALFIAAENDNFVMPSHSQKIYDKYGGDKNIMIVEGDHNTPRPIYIYDAISIFLQSVLQIPESWILPEGRNYTRRLPWTYRGGSKPGPHGGYNPAMFGKLSVDELLAMQLMEENGPNLDYESEQAMQQGVKEGLYNFLSGGGNSSSSTTTTSTSSSSNSKKTATHGTIAAPPPATKANGAAVLPPPAPAAVQLLDDPKTNELCPSEMTTMARKYSQTEADLKKAKGKSSTSAIDATWTCNTCTLINTIDQEICEACGVLRFD